MNNFILACASCDRKRIVGFAGMAFAVAFFIFMKKKFNKRKLKKEELRESEIIERYLQKKRNEEESEND